PKGIVKRLCFLQRCLWVYVKFVCQFTYTQRHRCRKHNRQTVMFSATMPLGVRELADEFLSNAEYVSVDPISSASVNVNQKVYQVEKEDKKKLLHLILEQQELQNVLIFTRTKQGADNVVAFLQKKGYKADAIHGDKSQNIRLKTLEDFKNKN